MNLAICFKNTDLACYYMMVVPFHDILYEKNMKNLQTNIYLQTEWKYNESSPEEWPKSIAVPPKAHTGGAVWSYGLSIKAHVNTSGAIGAIWKIQLSSRDTAP